MKSSPAEEFSGRTIDRDCCRGGSAGGSQGRSDARTDYVCVGLGEGNLLTTRAFRIGASPWSDGGVVKSGW